uniref:Potassium channel domain-containing protein n=1 Tax=Euplotes crassus TaxID=5936 RepID=A0A7S3KH51_EUPCR|mmetsp:Transcript_26679/g.26570  ORF Transcript_26679/g.26570 Transcript_26679/m.26570 type:complete len:262 (+) Transcript_26679:863-1648(+)
MLRIYERPLSAISGQRFDKYATSIWNIIVTMSTVGYGDVFPKTIFGRILGSFICIWGVVVESMMVVTLSEGLELTIPQRNSYTLLQRLFFRDDLQGKAVRALRAIFLLKKKIKAKNLLYKTKKVNLKKKQLALEMIFKRQMNKFKKKEKEMRKFNTATEVTYLYNKIYSLQEDFEKIWKSDREINQIQIESMNKLQSLFNRKASEDMKNELNFISKQNDMRMTGQSFFESQLQTSIRTNFKENEEDKEAEEISEIQEKKLL